MAGWAGVLFDLFGTLVTFEPARLPTIAVEGRAVHSTLGALQPLLADVVPDVALGEAWQALATVSEEMAGARGYDHVELPSRERFRRMLVRVGCPDDRSDEGAVLLSRAHMRCIADATILPDGHGALLAAVRRHHRTALVSNFDDTATAYDILGRHGLLPYLEVVVVSEALGLRKPHPALARVPLRELRLAPAEALFVGDTFAEDVGAAHAAAVDAAWIDVRGTGVPDGAQPPRLVLRRLRDLAPHLGV